MLRTIFNAKDGLSEEVSIRLYQRAVAQSGTRDKLKAELKAAFSNPETSWRHLLCNDDYEVLDFETEAEAREHALRILWEPIIETP